MGIKNSFIHLTEKSILAKDNPKGMIDIEKGNTSRVTIVTLNYNQNEVTHQLLRSCENLTFDNFDVIVVDNNSVEKLEQSHSYSFPINYVINNQNLGYAGGINTGIRNTDAPYVFIVNNDTETTPDLLNKLVEFADGNDVGIVCPMIKFYDDKERIQYAGYTSINPYIGKNMAMGFGEIDDGQYKAPISTPYAHGAAMLVSRAVLDKIGFMPEEYFLYYEELDYSIKARRAGFRIIVLPDAIIYHKGSVSVGKNSSMKTYYLSLNRYKLIKNNFSSIESTIYLIYYSFIVFPKNVFLHLLHGDIAHVKSLFRSYGLIFKSAFFSGRK